jgi:hypothetical protein
VLDSLQTVRVCPASFACPLNLRKKACTSNRVYYETDGNNEAVFHQVIRSQLNMAKMVLERFGNDFIVV